MSTDNKTLADVQPGGRVRLGDHDEKPPQELPDLIVTRGDGIPLPDQAAGIEEFKRQCLRRIEAEYPHLSAQPSPGGQGDARSFVIAAYRKDGKHSIADAMEDGSYFPPYVQRAVNAVEAALAARQPVGEEEQPYNSGGIELTACQLHEALLMAGDPELDVPFEDRSLVRIFWTGTGHSGPGLYCECVGAEEEGCILLDGTAPAIGEPAQAVDLGAVREAVRKAWQKCAAGESVDLQFGTLLALIDSMAVGK